MTMADCRSPVTSLAHAHRQTETRMHAAQQHLFLRIHTCTQGIKWEGAYQILWKLKRAFESGLNVGICTKY